MKPVMDGTAFTRQLLDWYEANGRDLPWRRRPEPYGVWVSEVMAQQTQIDRVVEYHARWMRRFPDIKTLAKAREDEVLNLWEGLGYYSRARNMHQAALLLMTEYGGRFPSDFSDIRSLPGVGDYTAGAVASIAFGQPEPAVDANVLRVFSRLLDVNESVRGKSGRSRIEKQVRLLMPDDRPGDFNQAIMELGALVCRRNPECDACPVQGHCLALKADTVALRPVLPAPKETIRIDMATGVLVHRGRVLIQKRKLDDIWPGLWEFPGGCIEDGETPEQALVREYMEEVELAVRPVEKIKVIKYAYTRYRVTMHCYLCRFDGAVAQPVFNEAVDGGFVSPLELDTYAFPSGHRRLAAALEADERFASFFSQP